MVFVTTSAHCPMDRRRFRAIQHEQTPLNWKLLHSMRYNKASELFAISCHERTLVNPIDTYVVW